MEPGGKRERQRVDKSFETILDLAWIVISPFTIYGTNAEFRTMPSKS